MFASLFPSDQSEFTQLKSAIEKLTLNDASVTIHQDNSVALGQGFRLGFLGLLHMDVFTQRLEQVCTLDTVEQTQLRVAFILILVGI